MAQIEERDLVDVAHHDTYHVPVGPLLYAVVASPFIWMAHLSVGPAFASYQCAHSVTWPINAFTVVSAIAIVAAMVIGWRIHRRARVAPASTTSAAVSFIALMGVLWGTISLFATILEGIPNLVGVASCPR